MLLLLDVVVVDVVAVVDVVVGWLKKFGSYPIRYLGHLQPAQQNDQVTFDSPWQKW